MIDLALLRRDPGAVRAALGRRGVDTGVVDALFELDAEHRIRLQHAEELRSEVKALSRQVAQARKDGDIARAEELQLPGRALGHDERIATAEAETVADEVRHQLLVLPNIPDAEAPDGMNEDDNVEVARWWPGIDDGAAPPEYAPHQRVAHWEIGDELQILDFERGARLAGSMFPLFKRGGARLLRALTWYSLDVQSQDYTEVRPPTLVLTETLTASGHLPKFVDEAYAVERDGLWAIPTAEVPLTSMHRGELLDESELPLRYCATTPCFRREAGAAGKDTAGCSASMSSTRPSCSPTARRPRRRGPSPTSWRGPRRLAGAGAAVPGARPVHGGPRRLLGPHLRAVQEPGVRLAPADAAGHDARDDVRRPRRVVQARARRHCQGPVGGEAGQVGLPLAEEHPDHVGDTVVDVVLREVQAVTHGEQLAQSDGAAGVGGAGRLGDVGGASRSSRPSPTRRPTTAWRIDLAIDQLSSRVPAVTGVGSRSKCSRAPW